jgi:hypothetical protein
MAENGEDWGRKPDFYERYVGEVSRPRPGLVRVRWLDARPSVFWNLPEREFAAALAERRESLSTGPESPDVCERRCSAMSSAVV